MAEIFVWKCFCVCAHEGGCLACNEGNHDMHQVPVPAHGWEPDFSDGEPPKDSTTCGLCGGEHSHAD